jgi:histone-lysine N-methyltransferase SETMAR
MESVEYRSVVKFLLLRNTSASDIIFQLRDVYKDACPCNATIYNWIRDFKAGRTSVFDAHKPGRPVEFGHEKFEKMEAIIRDERRITTGKLAKRVGVSKGALQEMLRDLGIRKLCSRFVPRFLTGEMQNRRLECSIQNLELLDNLGDSFLNNIVTEDETPLSLYIPETKRQSAEWVMPGEKPAKKMRTGTSHKKCLMLTVFWDVNGIIKVDFADKNTRINSQYYSNLITEARTMRGKRRSQQLWLLHDNAPIHKSHLTEAAIASCGFSVVAHPPYSPDLAPSDFHLFRRLKHDLRGKIFTSGDELKGRAQDLLESYPKSFYKEGFLELAKRWRKCVDVFGSYVEK